MPHGHKINVNGGSIRHGAIRWAPPEPMILGTLLDEMERPPTSRPGLANDLSRRRAGERPPSSSACRERRHDQLQSRPRPASPPDLGHAKNPHMNVLNRTRSRPTPARLESRLKETRSRASRHSARADFIAGADLRMLPQADTSDAAKLDGPVKPAAKMFVDRRPAARGGCGDKRHRAGWRLRDLLDATHRIAAANPKARSASRAVKTSGLLKGGGGTQRYRG